MAYDSAEKIHTWSAVRGSAHDYYEKPAIYSLTPEDLSGLDVLSIGCGLGEECDVLASRGGRVLGIDASSEMISLAAKNYPRCEFIVSDFDRLKLRLKGRSFGFAFSSLALHYSPDLEHTLCVLSSLLAKSADFVFSMHHPVYWGSERSNGDTTKTRCLGYIEQESERIYYGNYMSNRKLSAKFKGEFSATFYHYNMATIVNSIINAGFRIKSMLEPLPIASCKEADLSFFDQVSRVPMFVVFRVTRE